MLILYKGFLPVMNNPDTFSMLITLVVLACTVCFFVMGKVRTDVVALCAVLALALFGVLTPAEAFSGFSNSVVFVIAGMFIVSGAIVRTGLASIISKKILGVAGKNTNVLFMLVMLLAAVIGSLVSNTGTVAIMMPIVVSLAMSISESPSRFLMPLAFMSSIGGMFTLIGNSPNMVVNDAYVKAGYPSLQLFSFFPVGVVCLLFGMLVLAPLTSIYLSRRKDSVEAKSKRSWSLMDLVKKYHLEKNMYAVTVTPGCELVGMTLAEARLPERFGVVVQEVERVEQNTGVFHLQQRKRHLAPAYDMPIRGGDVLRVLGNQGDVDGFISGCGLMYSPAGAQSERAHAFGSIGICELVLMSASRLVNRTVAESDLRRQFGITVLGIQRGDKYILDGIKDQVMQSGDALLVQGAWVNLDRLEEFSPNWVVVGRPHEQVSRGRLREKIPVVVAVLAAMIGSMALNLVPTVIAVVLAAVVLVLSGCFKNVDEAYSVISWETVVMIASLLPMAVAMEKTGLVGLVAGRMVEVCSSYGPYVALGVVYGMASFMNIFLSTTPVALLLSPVAVEMATSLGYDPLPFLLAVATAASMCFASPFSTPSNALVMSAGRYTFWDYLKIGLPLQVLMGVVMVFALPLVFPFTAR